MCGLRMTDRSLAYAYVSIDRGTFPLLPAGSPCPRPSSLRGPNKTSAGRTDTSIGRTRAPERSSLSRRIEWGRPELVPLQPLAGRRCCCTCASVRTPLLLRLALWVWVCWAWGGQTEVSKQKRANEALQMSGATPRAIKGHVGQPSKTSQGPPSWALRYAQPQERSSARFGGTCLATYGPTDIGVVVVVVG